MAGMLDAAICKALNLNPAGAVVTNHGGSIVSTTLKIAAKVNGVDRLYFVKTSADEDAGIMFAGEHMSLNAIHDIVPTFCPVAYAHGSLSTKSGYFLATEFLQLHDRSARSAGTGLSFAAKLAKLHSVPAPVPEGFSCPQYGFPVPTCCGSTIQPNDFSNSWADFYANQRLRAIAKESRKNNGPDHELDQLIERTASVVVPQLLGDGHLGGEKGIFPVIVHGDLWSGNHGRGAIGDGPVEEVVYDACASYAHNEFELGIMKMFGGFGSGVMKEYHEICPKTEPIAEYEDRVALYELYHHLNHHSMFGGGYRSGAEVIMSKLLKKYDGNK